MAHGHNGAFFAWRPRCGQEREEDAAGGASALEGAWDSEVIGAGHYGPVQDLAWEPAGRYLMSVSKDQTSRLWAPWTQGREAAHRTRAARSRRADLLGRVEEDSTFGVLIELARPQVHGFDLKCLSFVGSRTHAYVSGADDEKVLRLLNAPTAFLDTLATIAGHDAGDDPDKGSRSLFASLPALGLSNKPMADSQSPPGGGASASAAAPELPAAAGLSGDGEGEEGESKEIEALMLVKPPAPCPPLACPCWPPFSGAHVCMAASATVAEL
jgi:elongator complex protein 2